MRFVNVRRAAGLEPEFFLGAELEGEREERSLSSGSGQSR
jgi:hypothetical protein